MSAAPSPLFTEYMYILSYCYVFFCLQGSLQTLQLSWNVICVSALLLSFLYWMCDGDGLNAGHFGTVCTHGRHSVSVEASLLIISLLTFYKAFVWQNAFLSSFMNCFGRWYYKMRAGYRWELTGGQGLDRWRQSNPRISTRKLWVWKRSGLDNSSWKEGRKA